MPSEASMKNSLIIFAILFFALISFSADRRPTAKEIEAISEFLNFRTNGNDSLYSKILSPAQSLETDKNRSERVKQANDKIVAELRTVVLAFKQADEVKKLESVKAAVNSIEPEVVKNGGAFISFTDSNPSGATSRTFLMISKQLKADLAAKVVFNTLLSYKRSAKPSDHVFEYPSADNLTLGPVKYTVGNDSTWKGDQALPAFPINQDIVLKKCRQLLGWRCVTSLYHAENFLKAADATNFLFVSAYDIENNPDFSDFAKDKRSLNQISGSTAIYVVKESANWILLYGVDTQWNNGKLSFQSAIQNEFKKDFDRFKERITSDLAIQL